MVTDSWSDTVDWSTPAGEALKRLVGILPRDRLDAKDVEAFRVVLRRTGHPTETELIHELQMAVDLFRPSFDEEKGHDLENNCRRLWPLIYGREFDPRTEIIAPALRKRREGYGEPTRDYKQELRETLSECRASYTPWGRIRALSILRPDRLHLPPTTCLPRREFNCRLETEGIPHRHRHRPLNPVRSPRVRRDAAAGAAMARCGRGVPVTGGGVPWSRRDGRHP